MAGTESEGASAKAAVSHSWSIRTQVGASRHCIIRIVVPLADKEIRQVRCNKKFTGGINMYVLITVGKNRCIQWRKKYNVILRVCTFLLKYNYNWYTFGYQLGMSIFLGWLRRLIVGFDEQYLSHIK